MIKFIIFLITTGQEMFRGNIAELENLSVVIKKTEIAHCSGAPIIDTETGQMRINYSYKLPLTGHPLLLSKNVLGMLEVHYEDHKDCFWFDHGGINHNLFVGDYSYLGCYYECIGQNSCHKRGDDLEYSGLTIPDFFKNCKKFLYVTDQEFDFDENNYKQDLIPHYVDNNGVIHGRDPVFVTKTDAQGKEFTILLDQNLCVFDEGKWVFIVWANRGNAYEKLSAMDISYIEIYPDVCLIVSEGVEYCLCEGGLKEIEPGRTIYPTFPLKTKSARNVM